MIGIICAMDVEKDTFLEKLSDKEEIVVNNITYIKGKMFNKDVVLTECGVGKVNATIATVLMINAFKPKLIINSGCAGSLNPDVHVLDVVIANKITHHDIDIPGHNYSFNDENYYYKSNDYLINLASNLNTNINFKVGPIVSGESFIYKKDDVTRILNIFPEVYAGEMEGSAIAQTCTFFNTSFLIVRGISDETLKDNNENLIYDYLNESCENSSLITSKIIEVLDEKNI